MPSNQVVLHTIASLKRSSGGTSTVVPALCSKLGSSGATVFLLTQDWPDSSDLNILPDPKYVQMKMAQASFYPKLGIPYSPFYSQAVADLCKNKCIRIIHDNGLWLPSNHAAARVARRFRTPLVIQPHGMLEPWAMNHRAWKKGLAWKLYQRRDIESAALLVATSVQEAESIRKVGLRQPIAVIPNGIDLPEWKERPFREARGRFALFLSRIHPVKGLMNLVTAWARVRPKGWRLVLAGPDEGNHRHEIEMAVQEVGLEKDILFIGPVEGAGKEKLYQEADLFILPTHSENFGVVVAEALAYGVPVITTKGAPWEGLVTHRCGWWVDVGVEPLADAVREATELSDVERRAMGERGRRYAEQFEWARIAEQMLAVYRWVLGQSPKPECVLFG